VAKKITAVKKYFFIIALVDDVPFVLVDKCILLPVNKRLKKRQPAFFDRPQDITYPAQLSLRRGILWRPVPIHPDGVIKNAGDDAFPRFRIVDAGNLADDDPRLGTSRNRSV
jgi:hypothetical protein